VRRHFHGDTYRQLIEEKMVFLLKSPREFDPSMYKFFKFAISACVQKAH
jgi:hypothetical protein